MRRRVHLVAILLLLATAAPVMACVTGSAMSHEASACCRTMHGQCGDMARMGCCRTELRTDQTPQLATTSPVLDIQWVVVDRPAPRIAAVRAVAPMLFELPEDYFPPGLVTARVTVLRI